MSAGHGRIPNGIITESIGIPSAYIDTRHATYISTPRHGSAWSPFHHVVQLGNRPATVVTTSPVTTPDGMMRRTAVNRT